MTRISIKHRNSTAKAAYAYALRVALLFLIILFVSAQADASILNEKKYDIYFISIKDNVFALEEKKSDTAYAEAGTLDTKPRFTMVPVKWGKTINWSSASSFNLDECVRFVTSLDGGLVIFSGFLSQHSITKLQRRLAHSKACFFFPAPSHFEGSDSYIRYPRRVHLAKINHAEGLLSVDGGAGQKFASTNEVRAKLKKYRGLIFVFQEDAQWYNIYRFRGKENRLLYGDYMVRVNSIHFYRSTQYRFLERDEILISKIRAIRILYHDGSDFFFYEIYADARI